MAKSVECTLIVNTSNGHNCQPIKCKSIASAVRIGKSSCGFAYRVFVGNKVVRSGYCD
jgi:hypothetical protein